MSRAAPNPHRSASPALQAALTIAELLSRAGVPAGVWCLARGPLALAAAVSAVTFIASLLRAFIASIAIERALKTTFSKVLNTALQLALQDLRAERKIGLLAEAARESAAYEATIFPLVIANAIAMAITWTTLVIVLGPYWAIALFIAAAPIFLSLAFTARRIRIEQETAWNNFSDLAVDLRVLIEASIELRAHGRESAFANNLTHKAYTFAAAERRANVLGAVSSAIPAALILLSSATPIATFINQNLTQTTGHKTAEMAIFSGAALYFAVTFGKLLENRARYTPFRQTLQTFLQTQNTAFSSSETSSPQSAQIAFQNSLFQLENISCRHPHAKRQTPERVSLQWPAGVGLVLSGQNGAGKSTLAMALLGLIPFSEGTLFINHTPATPQTLQTLRSVCAYLAQNPFIEPGASVAWHLRLFSRNEISNEQIDSALKRVHLYSVLQEHSSKSGSSIAPRDVLAGELSGGERQRMHIARILLQNAQFIILDEPEAGLDHNARIEMAALFNEIAQSTRVLMIAHDPAVVPHSFMRISLGS
ncbi:MAG: ABC transporter ATP-binding protein/permease [Polyangiaceae bacterium]|nr:ABC transporter ATP-binding protein/permease [Polyangiaceae bacterium]